MSRIACILVAATSLCACTNYWGSSTTERPAITEPTIGADGAFWDAIAAAERGDAGTFRLLLSPRFIHEAVLPRERRGKPDSAEAFESERLRLEEQLRPHEAVVLQMVDGYMRAVVTLTENRFVEVGKPDNQIEYRDGYRRAVGPNRSKVRVLAWDKRASAAEARPETLVVHFVQDGSRWLIDDFEPNRLKGAFAK